MHFIIISNHYNSQIILIFLFYHIYKSSSNCFSVIIRVDKKIMNVGIHYSVIHNTYHSNEFILIPSGINCIKVFHCDHKFIREMPR